MVELDERVDEQLPVRVDRGAVAVVLGHLMEGGVTLQALAELAEVLLERDRVVVEVDEDEASHTSQRTGLSG